MRVGIPYKVVGGTRFYDRREIKDALAYLRAVVNPADEVSRQAGAQRAQARRRRHARVGRLDAWATGHGRPVHRGAAPGRRRRASAAGRQAASRAFLELLDDAGRAASTTGPAPVLEALLERSGLPRRAAGRAHRRGRGPAREPRRAGRVGRASSRRSTSSSSRSASWPTPTSSTATTRRSCS